jgi:hypothetical protein
MGLVWHYTIKQYEDAIIETQKLIVSKHEINYGVKPALWLLARQTLSKSPAG